MRKLLAILLLMIMLLLASFFSFPIKGTVQPIHTGPTMELSRKLIIGQTFESRSKDLSRIDVYMTGSRIRHRGDIILRLYETGPGGVLLRTGKLDSKEISGDVYARFPIKTLHDSQGRRLFFTIDTGEVKPADIRAWFYSDDQAYKNGQGFANEGQLGGDVKFRTYHRMGFYQWLAEYASRVAAGKPGLAGYPAIIIILILLILGGFAYLIAQIFDEGKQTEQRSQIKEVVRERG